MSGWRCLSAIVLGAVAIPGAEAADWTLASEVEIGAAYSDNFDVLPEDSPDETIIRLVPGLELWRDGESLDIGVDASFAYERQTERGISDSEPRVSARAIQTLAKQRLWLVAVGEISQRRSDDIPLEIDATRDRDDTYEFRIGPLYERQFGDAIDVSASYSYGVAEPRDADAVGSDSHSLDGEIRQRWGNTSSVASASASHDFIRFEDDAEASASTILGTLSLPVLDQLSSRAVIGVDYIDLPDLERSSSPVWGVGLQWRPSRRIEADLQYLERDFGSQPSVEVSWGGRLSSFNLSWQRSLSIQRELEFDVDPVQGDFRQSARLGWTPESTSRQDESVVAPENDAEGLSPLRANASSVTETVKMSVFRRGRIGEVGFQASRYERWSLDSDTSGKARGTLFRIDYRQPLSRRLDLALSLNHLRRRDAEDSRTAAENRFDISLTLAL